MFCRTLCPVNPSLAILRRALDGLFPGILDWTGKFCLAGCGKGMRRTLCFFSYRKRFLSYPQILWTTIGKKHIGKDRRFLTVWIIRNFQLKSPPIMRVGPPIMRGIAAFRSANYAWITLFTNRVVHRKHRIHLYCSCISNKHNFVLQLKYNWQTFSNTV